MSSTPLPAIKDPTAPKKLIKQCIPPNIGTNLEVRSVSCQTILTTSLHNRWLHLKKSSTPDQSGTNVLCMQRIYNKNITIIRSLCAWAIAVFMVSGSAGVIYTCKWSVQNSYFLFCLYTCFPGLFHVEPTIFWTKIFFPCHCLQKCKIFSCSSPVSQLYSVDLTLHLEEGWDRGQHVQGQGRGSSRPRPKPLAFIAKAKANLQAGNLITTSTENNITYHCCWQSELQFWRYFIQ